MAALFSSTQRIVVDDSDPRIQYSNGWINKPGDNLDLGTQGPTFLGSQHGILESGQFQFTFTFTGTTIEVYGTNGQVFSGGVSDPQWICFVDSDSISSPAPSSDVQNNWSICERDGLSNESHVLTVQITSKGRGKFWFDRLMYTPLKDTSGEILWLNYADSAILYDSNWVFNNIMRAFTNDTTMSANFGGAAWTWVGELQDDGPALPSSFTYQIDDGAPITRGIDGRPPNQTALLTNHVFFSTSLLMPGSHTLSFTYKGTNGVPMSLAYAYVFSNSTQVPIISQIWPSQADLSVSAPLNPVPSPSSLPSSSSSASSSQSASVISASLSRQLASMSLSLATKSSATLTASSPGVSLQLSSSEAAATTPNISSLSSTTTVKSSHQTATEGNHAPWHIIVAVLCSIFALALIFVLLYFWFKRRRNRLSPFISTTTATSLVSEKPGFAAGVTPDTLVGYGSDPMSSYTALMSVNTETHTDFSNAVSSSMVLGSKNSRTFTCVTERPPSYTQDPKPRISLPSCYPDIPSHSH